MATKRVAKVDVVYGGKRSRLEKASLLQHKVGIGMRRSSLIPICLIWKEKEVHKRRSAMDGVSIDVSPSGLPELSWRLHLVSFRISSLRMWSLLLTESLATLFKRIPTLKLAIPSEEVKYPPPRKDGGISELPVIF